MSVSVESFHKECISSEEAKRIKKLSEEIAFEVSLCGPIQVESKNTVKKTHTIIRGFDASKARIIIEDLIWKFLLDEEYGKAIKR